MVHNTFQHPPPPPTSHTLLVGSLKKNTALEYSTRVVQEGDRRCKKSTLNDLAYLTPLRIPLMNPVCLYKLYIGKGGEGGGGQREGTVEGQQFTSTI
jgi:hypothetical protein